MNARSFSLSTGVCESRSRQLNGLPQTTDTPREFTDMTTIRFLPVALFCLALFLLVLTVSFTQHACADGNESQGSKDSFVVYLPLSDGNHQQDQSVLPSVLGYANVPSYARQRNP